MITIKAIAPLRQRQHNKIIAENSAISTKRLSRMTILVTMIIARAKARGGAFAEKWHEKCDVTRNEPLSLGKMCIKHVRYALTAVNFNVRTRVHL